MPVKVQKMDGKYRVSTPNQTHAFGTSRAKAKRQANLLRAIDHGWQPTGKPARDKRHEGVHAAALAVVDRLLNEVDQIGSVPIPASGKAYARIHGMRGLRNKQQLYIKMARDLGNRGKPTHGFKDYDGSAYTGPKHEAYEPDATHIAWASRLLGSLRDGAHWVVPATGQVYQVDHSNRTLTLIHGDTNDPQGWHRMNKVLFAKVGYNVLDQPQGNDSEMSFAEAMDDAPVTKPLERSHVEKTKLHGGKYGKGVERKGKTAGKFKFPANFKVGHAIKS